MLGQGAETPQAGGRNCLQEQSIPDGAGSEQSAVEEIPGATAESAEFVWTERAGSVALLRPVNNFVSGPKDSVGVLQAAVLLELCLRGRHNIVAALIIVCELGGIELASWRRKALLRTFASVQLCTPRSS